VKAPGWGCSVHKVSLCATTDYLLAKRVMMMCLEASSGVTGGVVMLWVCRRACVAAASKGCDRQESHAVDAAMWCVEDTR
jgi:hypothetical protein